MYAIRSYYGKMGPSLCVRARQAARAGDSDLQVIAISRFSDKQRRSWLEERGVQTRSYDLLDRTAVARLPRITSYNVCYTKLLRTMNFNGASFFVSTV